MPLSICCLFTCALLLHGCSSNTEPGGSEGGGGGQETQGGSGGQEVPEGGEGDQAGQAGGASGGASGGAGGIMSFSGAAAGASGAGGAAGTPAQGGNAGAGGAPLVTSSCPQAACQTFETELQPAVWSLSAKGGTAKVVSDEITALRGTGKAMQFHLLKTNEEAASTGFVSLKTVPDAVKKGGGDLFARFYTYFSAPHDFRHSYIFRGNGAANESNIEIGGQTGNRWILAPLGKVFPPTGSIPVKKWFCFEAQFEKATGELKLLVDGQQAATATATSPEPLTTYRFIQFGLGTFHELTTDLDLYVDDIAVDVKPIGCLPK